MFQYFQFYVFKDLIKNLLLLYMKNVLVIVFNDVVEINVYLKVFQFSLYENVVKHEHLIDEKRNYFNKIPN